MKLTNNKIFPYILTGVLALTLFTGCSSSDSKEAGASQNANTSADAAAINFTASEMFTDRDMNASYDESSAVTITFTEAAAACSNNTVNISDSTITISEGGTYILEGSSENMQVRIDAAENDKIQLVLNDLTLSCETSAPIYVKNADKVFVTLAPDTNNTLSTTNEYIQTDDNTVDAVLFSKADLTLNGSGSLTISSPYGHGIVSKDDLAVTGGTYSMTCARHGLSGKDSVRILDGTFYLTTTKDGIHASNDDDDTLGYIYIAGGTFTISSDDDGIHADSTLYIEGSDLDIVKSYEGLEGQTITILDGNISIVSSDDGINASSGSSTSDNNQMPENAPNGTAPDNENVPDSIPTDNAPDSEQIPDNAPPDSVPDNEKMPGSDNPGDEQIPDSVPNGTAPGNGQIPDNAPDSENIPDNAPDNNNSEIFLNNTGNFDMDADESCTLTISGGTLTIDADGDGIDTNGYFYMTGGTIFIAGPENNGNSALDYGISAVISGGYFLASGFSGMAQNFSSASTQCACMVTLQTPADSSTSTIKLTDSNGATLLTHTTAKSYNSVIFSCPELTVGDTCTLYTGETTQDITITDIITPYH